MEALSNDGVKTFYGRWLIDGDPRVLLMDVEAAYPFFDEWKHDFENISGILLPSDDDKTNDAITFGYLVTRFFREVICFYITQVDS